jgi:MFS family permease
LIAVETSYPVHLPARRSLSTEAEHSTAARKSTANGDALVLEPQRFPLRLWLIALAGWMFDFYDLVLFSFLLMPIGRDLNLSEGQEAVLLGVALGASGIGGILFGYLSDLYGRKRTLMWTVCLYSLGTGLTACASGFVTLFLFRLITGMGVGGEWAVGHALLAESTPKHVRGRGAALLQMGEPLGVALAAVTGLLLAPLLGWRLVFAISSASAIVAVVARSHLPESVVWERQREQSFSPRAAVKMIGELHLWRTLAKGWILGVFKLGTYWSCYVWLPKFLQDQMQQPVGRSALWILTSQLGQFLGMLAFGLVADKFGRRRAFTAYSLLTAAALYPLAFHWRQLLAQPIWFWASLFALGLGSGCTAGFGALLAELFPTQIRNFAMGIAYNCARGVQFLAPIVVGRFVAAYGLAGGLSVPLVLSLATAMWVWTLPETRSRDLALIAAEVD